MSFALSCGLTISDAHTGLSLKTLELYVFVFLFRLSSVLRYQGYLPYDRSGDWLYSLLEITALALCCYVIYLVTVRFNSTYELRYDTFGWLHVPTELGALYILVPCILFGMVRSIWHAALRL